MGVKSQEGKTFLASYVCDSNIKMHVVVFNLMEYMLLLFVHMAHILGY